MNLCKLFFFLSVAIFKSSSQIIKYIYGEVNGTLQSDNLLNFSIFIMDFQGIILYAIDSNSNKLLIDLSSETHSQIINVKYNNMKASEKIKNICQCLRCYNKYMIFSFQFMTLTMNITCNGRSTLILLNDSLDSDFFISYPIPKDFSYFSKTVYIWMGNVGPYYGFNFKRYFEIKTQLTGCLDKFYLLNKSLNFSNNVKQFYPSCNLNIIEKCCKKDKCSSDNIAYKMYNCSISIFNNKYCKHHLMEYMFSEQSSSFSRISDRSTSTWIKLKWIQKLDLSTKISLIEIIFEDNSSNNLFIDEYQHLILISKRNENKEDFIKTFNISKQSINMLIINFNMDNIKIKILNDELISCIILSPSFPVKRIHIGFFEYTTMIVNFQGQIEFQYDPAHFKFLKENEERKDNYYIFLIWSILFISFIVIIILLVILRIKKSVHREKKTEIEIPAVIPQNIYEYQLMPIPKRESPIYDELVQENNENTLNN